MPNVRGATKVSGVPAPAGNIAMARQFYPVCIAGDCQARPKFRLGGFAWSGKSAARAGAMTFAWGSRTGEQFTSTTAPGRGITG